MPKARKLTEVERSRILGFHKQDLSQRAIAATVNRSKTDRGLSSSQIKAVTDADCSPITIRRYLQQKGIPSLQARKKRDGGDEHHSKRILPELFPAVEGLVG